MGFALLELLLSNIVEDGVWMDEVIEKLFILPHSVVDLVAIFTRFYPCCSCRRKFWTG